MRLGPVPPDPRRCLWPHQALVGPRGHPQRPHAVQSGAGDLSARNGACKTKRTSMSRITTLRTIRIDERPNLIWVEIETDEGLTGLGESFRGAQAVEAAVHELAAPLVLGQDSRRIEAISRQLLTPYLGFHSVSAEVRAASAIDIALWDIKGQRHGIPVHEALGGASRLRIRAYNTCAGYAYNTNSARRREIGADDASLGPYDDQIAFMR